MNWKIEKQKIWKLTGGFFAAMAAFTLLSRAAYQHGIAVVTTQAPAGGTISHQVVLTGKTVQNQEQAVTTEAGLRIAGVYVNEGQQVKQGDVLFTLDLDYLDEEILHQKQAMQKPMFFGLPNAVSRTAAAPTIRPVTMISQYRLTKDSFFSIVSSQNLCVLEGPSVL